jgi:hypothetical protein
MLQELKTEAILDKSLKHETNQIKHISRRQRKILKGFDDGV